MPEPVYEPGCNCDLCQSYRKLLGPIADVRAWVRLEWPNLPLAPGAILQAREMIGREYGVEVVPDDQ